MAMLAPDTTGTLFSAVYDSNGKMLDVLTITPAFANGQAFCNLVFDPMEDAASLNLMYLAPTSYKTQLPCTFISPAT